MRNKYTSVLAVGGDFTQDELAELAGIMSKQQIAVYPYITNAIEFDEIVRLVFQNFDAISFLRDGILFEVLWKSLDQAKQWVLTKKPRAKIMPKINLRFKTKTSEIPVNIGLPLDSQFARKEIEKTLTVEFLESYKKGDIVDIYWDMEKNKVSVIKL